MLRSLTLLGCLLVSAACSKTTWRMDPKVLVPVRQVAQALDDPYDVGPQRLFDPSSIPDIDPPKSLRPCCAFGDDLKVRAGNAIPLAGYQIKNVKAAEELGRHGYDNGYLGIESSHGKPNNENNGLVYTCRGGFIDLAHVRDNADLTLFLSLRLARVLPLGTTIDLPSDGAERRVVVKSLPEGLLQRYGRWYIASTLAEWIAYHMSIWHEIVTWYGYENIKGFSERESSFSPEDLYSNVLGIRLAAGIIRDRTARSREEYDLAMDVWIQEALRRLDAVPKKQGKQAIKSVDGLWWDSKKAVPDFLLVLRRNLEIKLPQEPWLVTEAAKDSAQKSALDVMCASPAPPLKLDIAERIGDHKLADLISIEYTFKSWTPENFPYPDPNTKVVTPAHFPEIIEAIRKAGSQELGPGFNKPAN